MSRIADILMTEENRRFSIDGSRSLKGHIEIYSSEKKGIVSAVFRTEGLRPLDSSRYLYRLMILGLKNGKSLHTDIADFQAAAGGSTVISFELEPANVDGEGHPLSDFFVFMVVAASIENKREPYHPVMKGDWKQEGRQLYESESESGAQAQKIASEKENFNDYYEQYVVCRTAELIMKREQFAKAELFEAEWMADNWRVADETADFPVASVDSERMIVEHEHFIFAFNDDYLLLGVPGTGGNDSQPDGGASGFTKWHPVKGSAMHGYWLTAIKRKTGEIVGI